MQFFISFLLRMPLQTRKPRLDLALLTALLLETVLNGAFWVLFIQTVEVLLVRARSRKEGLVRPMFIIATILFITITGHWIVDLMLAFTAFIPSNTSVYCIVAGQPNPGIFVYLKLEDPKVILSSAFYLTSTLIGDAFMIYRLHIVCGNNKWIIVPPILMCGALGAAGGMVIYLFTQATDSSGLAAVGAWIISFFVLTFCCNMYSTLLIAVKIALSNRESCRGSTTLNFNNSLSRVMEVLIQSAALYAACVIVSLATYCFSSNVQLVTVAATNPIIGIIFCMIVVRAHSSGTSHALFHQSHVSKSSTVLQPLQIKVTSQIRSDAEVYTPTQSPDYTSSRYPSQQFLGGPY